MKSLRFIIITFFLVLIVYIIQAQNNNDIPAVNALRADGKIYVVVLVLTTVMMGILFLLTQLGKRINKLESNNKKNI